ncbi:MAG: hypothetical protein V3R89_08935, partial [Thermoanaerobaculia bacterium]
DGRRLLAWLGERDARGLRQLRALLAPEQPLVALPLLSRAPSDLESLRELADCLRGGLRTAM